MDLHEFYQPEKLQSHLCIISFQEALIKLNKNNVEYISNLILRTPLITHPDLVRRIAFNTLYIASIRPGHIPYLVEVLKFLIDHQDFNNSLSVLKDSITPKNIPKQRWYRSFLINCIIKQVITIDEFMNLLTTYPPNESLFLLFCWFAPLIQSRNETFYRNIESLFLRRGTILTPELTFFKENLDEMKKDNWKTQRIYFQNGYNKCTLEYYIKNDDNVGLMNLISSFEVIDDKTDKKTFNSKTLHEEKFDFDQRIEPSLFERCDFVRHRPTLIQFAAFFGSKKCFSILLSKGANTKIKDDEGKSLIEFVVAGGNMKIFNMCREAKNIDLEGAIQTTVEFHRYAMMITLIDQLDIDITESTEAFSSIFHYAAKYNNVRTIFFCLENGCSVNMPDFNGRTPLHFAAEFGQYDSLFALIDAFGIDVNAADKYGKTPLHLAAKNNKIDSIPILAILEDFDYNSCDENGNNAVITASKNGYDAIVYNLLCNDIDVNHKNMLGLAPLHFAVKKGRENIVSLLMTHNSIDVNITDEKDIFNF